MDWIAHRITLVTAVALNAIAGVVARKIAQRSAVIEKQPQKRVPDAQAKFSTLLLICFAGVGATAIAYELSWTRLLATPLGSSTYAFSLMLATFLLGIAIGSRVFEKWFRRKRAATAGVFGVTQLAIAGATLLSLWIYSEIPEVLLALLRVFGENFSALLAAQAVTCALALLPATILFGFNFPLVLALVAGSNRGDEKINVSARVGRAVAANTFGAILAAIAGGFFLLPWIGSFRLVALAACINIALGVALFLSENRRNWKPLAVTAALFIATSWTAWSPVFFSRASAAFGVVLYGSYHNRAMSAREMADTEDVEFFKDGINATIAVTRSENYIALKTNGKVDASNLDSGTQLLLGDLGAVFHPRPRKVLIIGFGGGMTASAVARFPDVERIDCVEIEPGVVEAAGHLARLNRGVLSDPRLHMYFDDARNFLQTSREQYDLIISEPSNPWIAGIASLYTDEFFAVVRAHLAPGGNFAQWIQAYGLKFDDFAMILAGIEQRFPDVSLWHSSGRDFLVLARNSTAAISFDRSRALWNNALLREDFKALHLTKPESWSAYFRLGRSEIQLLANHAARNTDDRTLLEYSAPVNLLNDSLTEQLETALAVYEKSPLPENLSSRDAQLAAVAAAETALESDPARAAKLLKVVPDSTNDAQVRILRARVKIADKQYAAAVRELESLPGYTSNYYGTNYWLAVAQRGAGHSIAAESTLDGLIAKGPDDESSLEAKVSLASERKDWAPAIEAQTRLAGLRSDSAAEQCRLGDLLMRSRKLEGSEAPLLKGLQIDSYAYLCHRELGELYRATGRTADAIKELEWSVRYFPEGDPKTYVSLALAYQTASEHAKAESALEKGKRLFPADPLLKKFSLNSD